jgi:transcriptional regulator with XRE-family HTH domain
MLFTSGYDQTVLIEEEYRRMPRPASRGKSKLSKAVCELRARLGSSQQSFSNRLGVALNTIARYETSREPSGEALLKLGNVAALNLHWDLSSLFYSHYLDEVLKDLHLPVVQIPATGSEPSRGYLLLGLRGDHELRYAHIFNMLLAASRVKDADVSKKARDLILQADKWLVEEMGLKPVANETSTAKEKKAEQ